MLAVSLIGGQTFVYVAEPKGDGYVAHQVPVTLGETVGNTYPVLCGLKPGDKVIISGLQFLQEGAPVKPSGLGGTVSATSAELPSAPHRLSLTARAKPAG